MQIEIFRKFAGQILWTDGKESLFLSRGTRIYQSNDGGISWQLRWKIPIKGWKPILETFRLTQRLLRLEIRCFGLLSDGTGISVTKLGIFSGKPNQMEMDFIMRPSDGTPLNITVDRQDRIFFGDYGFSYDVGKAIYVSADHGLSFEIIKQFEKKDIRHIHAIQEDPFEPGYWVFTGDFDSQPGIGRLSADLKHFDWLVRGNQMFRAVQAIIEKDFIYYGTDSEFEQNYIVKLEKHTGKWEKMCPIEGSSLYATKFGTLRLISTNVDHFSVTGNLIVYGSVDDDEEWTEVFRYQKDMWSPRYFQYGTCIFPQGSKPSDWGVMSGRALCNFDNTTTMFRWKK